MKRKIFPVLKGMVLSLMLLASLSVSAANTTKSVEQVTDTIALDTDVNFFITGTSPFGTSNGVVDIVNTEHAVLIMTKVKPSVAVRLLSHVKINGQPAVNNTNCQVKMYNIGSIILPYGVSTKPLTVYSEQNFEGESCNDFGLEHTGGYMNTLTDAKLNNRIRSFKLKRGYMVTFSLLAGGRGYSRCFIASNKDLEIAELPAVMDKKISSYRVFKWYDAGKKQLANDLTSSTLAALNVQSSYTWSQGHDMGPDYECVPNHIYEDYPSSSAIGSATWSPHTKNNNEPLNKSDDHPQDLETILNNWENMMRTGLRLCTPASWDGSDYVGNASGFLADFLDSIDARGWRCDIIDLHCYWAEGTFGQIHNWVDKYKRPVWISEWCWGASWNKNGAFADGVTEEQVKSALQRICSKLNGYNYVERYYYWNGERDPSRLYKNSALTPAGEYYSTMNSGLGYNGLYDFVPTTPKQYGFSNFSKTVVNGKVTLKWHDSNGEFNQKMQVQKRDENSNWVVVADVEQKEQAADYTYVIDDPDASVEYRLYMVDVNGIVYTTSDEKAVGEAVDMDGTTMYAGENMLFNGDFDLGTYGWQDGTGAEPSAPYFQAVPEGGRFGGSYLQAYGNGGNTTSQSILTIVPIEKNTNYYYGATTTNMNATYTKVSMNLNGNTEETKVVLQLKNSKSWLNQNTTFNTGIYPYLQMSFRWMGNNAQLDKVELRKLFSTTDEAFANGVELLKQKAEVMKTLNTTNPKFNAEIDAVLASLTGDNKTDYVALNKVLKNFLWIDKNVKTLKELQTTLDKLKEVKCYKYDEMVALADEAAATTSMTVLADNISALRELMDKYLDFSDAAVQPQYPSFDYTVGWETAVGTYKGGDQRKNEKDGKTFWNAWWSLSAAENPNETMEVRQTLTGIEEGIYTLECKAATEHYCLSDQHGYLKVGEDTVVTPNLSYDYYDLPVDNCWETLTTAPMYLLDNDTVTIGFVGSKNGAVDGQWKQYGGTATGDNREGWWCATDFVVKYHPVLKRTVVPNEWNVTCLPYQVRPAEGVTIYQIAGINSEYTQLCLEPLDSVTPGVPFIYRSENADVVFYEFGTPEKTPTDAPGNIRGFFKPSSASSRIGTGYYNLTGGAWEKVTSDRPYITKASGYIRPMDASSSKVVPVIKDWEGVTMPINGVTQAEIDKNNERILTAIEAPEAKTHAVEGIYTLDGRRLSSDADNLKRGIYIKVVNGKAYKTIIK